MVKHFQKRVGFSKVASKLGCKRYKWRTGMPFGGEEKASAHWSETSKHVCNPWGKTVSCWTHHWAPGAVIMKSWKEIALSWDFWQEKNITSQKTSVSSPQMKWSSTMPNSEMSLLWGKQQKVAKSIFATLQVMFSFVVFSVVCDFCAIPTHDQFLVLKIFGCKVSEMQDTKLIKINTFSS